MKKSLLSFLTLLLVFLLVSCNTVPEVTTGSTAGTTAATTVGGLFDTTQATTEYETTTSEDDEYEEPEWILNTTNKRFYSLLPTGVMMRKIIIKTHLDGPSVKIAQLTDTHINYCNEKDLLDPVLKSTYENRQWLKDGASLSNIRFTLKEADALDPDMIVLTGDVYDYYSEGVVEKANEYIFDAYDNILACIGNHEPIRQCEGKVADHLSYDTLRGMVADSWCNDISYESTVIENKVMLIAIDNSYGFRDEQVPRLTADLNTAREMGYVVLLFYHVPLCSGLESDNNIAPEWGNHQNWSFGTTSSYVGPYSKGVDAKIYSLIRRNGDIIRGLFCGHVHGDFYTEIPAKTIDGIDTMIPQYIMTPVAYNNGHFLYIVVE